MSNIHRIVGTYGIGPQPRRSKTDFLMGDYQLLKAVPTIVLAKVDDELVTCPVRIFVGGVLRNA